MARPLGLKLRSANYDRKSQRELMANLVKKSVAAQTEKDTSSEAD
jgi:hypothetical protein